MWTVRITGCSNSLSSTPRKELMSEQRKKNGIRWDFERGSADEESIVSLSMRKLLSQQLRTWKYVSIESEGYCARGQQCEFDHPRLESPRPKKNNSGLERSLEGTI